MKKVVSVNLGNFGSTGRIMAGISNLAGECGFETYTAYPDSKKSQPASRNDIIISSAFWNLANQKIAYYSGLNGCFAPFSTGRFLRTLDRIRPDILHFHNLHSSYINLPMLFGYVKKNHIKVVWTLHDCWSFTGHCAYFTLSGCEKWETGCGSCPALSAYPAAKMDRSAKMWKRKKEWFSGVGDLTIVTPSEWLAGLVDRSFLSDYPIKVINNGIDLSVFKPTGSDFREAHGIAEDEFLLLGVAFLWSRRKGLDAFEYLSEHLDSRYRIVLVGTDDCIDAHLPERVISIHRTQNQQELAQIYTAADLFVNPTREDNYPTVNLEALACGTPVVTFDTGGSAEIIRDGCGTAVSCGDMGSLLQAVRHICEEGPFSSEKCIESILPMERQRKFTEYIDLYNEILARG